MKTIEEGSEEEKIRLSGFYMNHSASTSIFQATHTYTANSFQRLTVNQTADYSDTTWRKEERGRGRSFGTTSSYASVGGGTTRAVIVNTIPWQ